MVMAIMVAAVLMSVYIYNRPTSSVSLFFMEVSELIHFFDPLKEVCCLFNILIIFSFGLSQFFSGFCLFCLNNFCPILSKKFIGGFRVIFINQHSAIIKVYLSKEKHTHIHNKK